MLRKCYRKWRGDTALFAGYTKDFDTIDFDILLHEIHKLNLSKDFLYWALSYVYDRKYLVENNIGLFGVPQRSIHIYCLECHRDQSTGTCVVDMSGTAIDVECLQYVSDTSPL